MKKITAILTAIMMLAALASCGAKEAEETTTAEETSAEEVTEAVVIPDDMTGMYEITAANNEGTDLNSVFGSEFANTGAQMTIGSDGYFDFDAGTWGGVGTAVENDGVVTATYTDNQEGAEQTLTLTFNAENRTYTMAINDAEVVWSLTQESDGDTAVIPEDMTGMYEITAANNEGTDLNSVFGSEFANTGAQMTIGSDGYFDFDAGTWGGVGTVTEDNGVLTATYTDNQEGAEQTLTLTFNADARTYTMNINDASVVWSITEEA